MGHRKPPPAWRIVLRFSHGSLCTHRFRALMSPRAGVGYRPSARYHRHRARLPWACASASAASVRKSVAQQAPSTPSWRHPIATIRVRGSRPFRSNTPSMSTPLAATTWRMTRQVPVLRRYEPRRFASVSNPQPGACAPLPASASGERGSRPLRSSASLAKLPACDRSGGANVMPTAGVSLIGQMIRPTRRAPGWSRSATSIVFSG